MGNDALESNTTGGDKRCYWTKCTNSNTTGTQNTGVGDCLNSNTDGDANTALGQGALGSNTGSNNSTANWSLLHYLQTQTAKNTAVGAYALDSNTSGSENNVAMVVLHLMDANTTGTRNVAIGKGALDANTTANRQHCCWLQCTDCYSVQVTVALLLDHKALKVVLVDLTTPLLVKRHLKKPPLVFTTPQWVVKL